MSLTPILLTRCRPPRKPLRIFLMPTKTGRSLIAGTAVALGLFLGGTEAARAAKDLPIPDVLEDDKGSLLTWTVAPAVPTAPKETAELKETAEPTPASLLSSAQPAPAADRRSVRVPLFDLDYLGTLNAGEKSSPWWVVKAKPCSNCSSEPFVWLIPSAAANSGNSIRPFRFVSPGRVLDPKTRNVLLDSRSFYGNCLREPSDDVYVVFQREKLDRKSRLWKSVYIAEPAGTGIREKLIERRLPPLEVTLQKVRQKKCFEISTRNRMMNRDIYRPYAASQSQLLDESAENIDDTPKENQTDAELPSPQE